MRPRQPTSSELAKLRRRARSLPKTPTLVEREQALVDNAVDKQRLDWMSEGEDTGTSNIYLVWQCMLSHAPGELRQVIDHLRRRKGKNT